MAERFNLTARLIMDSQIGNLRKVQSTLKKAFPNPYTIQLRLATNSLNAGLANVNKQLRQTKALVGSIGNVNIKTTAVQKIQQVGNSYQAAGKQAQGFAHSIQLATTRYAAFILGAGSSLAAFNRIRQGLEGAREFEAQIANIGQIVGTQISNLQGFQSEIFKTAKAYGVSSKSLADISETLLSANISIGEVTRLLPTVGQALLAPNFDNKNLADGIIVLDKFVEGADGYATALEKINRLSDSYATEAKSTIDFIKRVGASYREQSDDLNALLGISVGLRQGTRLSPGVLGNSFRSILGSLQKDSSVDLVGKFGGNLLTANGGLKQPIDQLKEIVKISDKLSKTPAGQLQFQNFVQELVGSFQSGRLTAIVQNFDLIEQAIQTAEDSQGSLARSTRIAQGTVQNAINKTAETYKELFSVVNNDGGFRSQIDLLLSLSNGFTSVVKSALPLLPLLAAFGASKGIGAISGLIPAAATGNRVPFSFRNPRTRLLGGLAGAGLLAAGAAQGGTTGALSEGVIGAVSGGLIGSQFGPLAAGLGAATGALLAFTTALARARENQETQTRSRLLTQALDKPNPENISRLIANVQSKKFDGPPISFQSFFGSREDTIRRFAEARANFTQGKSDTVNPVFQQVRQSAVDSIQSGQVTSLEQFQKRFGDINKLADLADDGLGNSSKNLDKLFLSIIEGAKKTKASEVELRTIVGGSVISSSRIDERARGITVPDALLAPPSFNRRNSGLAGNDIELLDQLDKAFVSIPQVLAGGNFSEEFAKEFTTRLSQAGLGPTVTDAIGKQLEGVKLEDFQKSIFNATDYTSRLLSPFSSVAESADQLAAKLTEAREASQRNLETVFNQISTARSSTFDAAATRLDILDEQDRFRQRPIDINRPEAFLAEFVGNTQDLGRSLFDLQAEFQRTKDVNFALAINDVKSRLVQLGDASLRLKNITEEQARVQASISNRENTVANYFGSDRSGRRQLERDRQSAIQAFDTGNLNNLSIRDQQQAVRFFQANQGIENFLGSGESTSKVFSGLLQKSNPEFFAGDIKRNVELQSERERRLADSLNAKEIVAAFERLKLNDMVQQLDSAGNKFIEAARQLAEVFIPETISLEGSLKPLEVNINGGQFFRNDEFSNLLTRTIRQELAKVLPADMEFPAGHNPHINNGRRGH